MLFWMNTIDGFQLGLCYAIVAMGMYIAFAVLDFSDLSADGTFPLGGVIGTIIIYRLGLPPVLALVGGFLAGAIMGAVTGLLHVKFGISKLLSGIIVMTGLFSVNLALTMLLTQNGFTITNFSYIVYHIEGLFNSFNPKPVVLSEWQVTLILLAVVVVIKLLLDLFLKTKIGYLLRATGNNEALVTSLGKNVGTYKVLGLSLANGLVALGGALYAQLTMNYDNTCGTGKVVLALASVIIGMSLFSKAKVVKSTTAVIVGAIIYSLCLNYFTLLDTNGTYLKMMNAICFALILIFNNRLKMHRILKDNHKTERENKE